MTTERIPTIWDQPLPRTKLQNQSQQHTRNTVRIFTIWDQSPRSSNTGRFLALWNRLIARLVKVGA